MLSKTLRVEKSWSWRCPMKEFPQKEWSRISLYPLIQKNWCLWYDWQLSW